VAAIRGFHDACVVGGEPVYILQKVQLLAFDFILPLLLGKTDLLDSLDISELPVFSDNVTPTILNYLNIIPTSTAAHLTDQQNRPLKSYRRICEQGEQP